MLRSYKYKIFPSEVQKERLACFFGVVRVVYNLGLETKTYAYTTHRASISKYDLMKQLPELKQEYGWMAECPAQALQHTLINLDTAYQNFFKNKAQFPKFKNRYRKQSITFPQGCRVDFENNTIKVPKLKNVSIDYSRKFKGTVKRMTISKTVTHKYFVSILVDTDEKIPKKVIVAEKTTVGIDFGINNLAIVSDGEVFENKHFFKTQEKRLRTEQRSLSRKKKGSNNYSKQKLVVALIHEKIRNQRIDYLHKISTHLVRKHNTIVLEDLSVSNMVKNHSLAKAINDVGWREFRTMLEYKADWHGKNIVIIGRFVPSSKICSSCGNIKSDLKLSDRMYNCDKCKYSEDRDINASNNIKIFGLRAQPISRQRKTEVYT